MVKVVVGMMGSSAAKGSSSLSTAAQVSSFLSVVKAHGIKELDTARVYNGGRSEELLGEVLNSGPGSGFGNGYGFESDFDFAISTKAPAFTPGSLSETNILENCAKSTTALRLGPEGDNKKKIDIYYLHGPDRSTDLESQCRAINTLHSQGHFRRFGVSNISDAEVQSIHDICSRQGYILPSVYQGMYNPLNRHAEVTLFPLLRRLNMVFYAFSPLAGGLLAKPLSQVMEPASEESRFVAMKVFREMFLTEDILVPLGKVQRVCDAEGDGVPLIDATLRWFMHHSPLRDGDAVVLGASSEEQIETSLRACEAGPLPESLVVAWEELWEEIRKNPPSH